MATLAQERITVTLPSGVASFLRRRADRGEVPFAERLNEFIVTAPRNVPVTDDEIMAEIKQVRSDEKLPQWEKDFIDQRLDMAQQHPNRLKPIDTLLKTL